MEGSPGQAAEQRAFPFSTGFICRWRCRYRAGNTGPFPQSAGRGLPRSMMRPCSSTMIQSELRTVDSRCAMTKVVRPFISRSIPSLNQGLGARIDRRGSLVQDQHRRICHRRPRNGEQAGAVPGSGWRRRRSARSDSRPAAGVMNPSALASLAASIHSSSVASSRP